MHKQMSKAALAAAVAAAVSGTMFAQSASAQLLMYEPFNYTTGQQLVGQTNPGTTKQWLDPGSPGQPAPGSDTQTILSGNAAIANLPATVGNQFNLPQTPNGNIARIELPNPGGYTYDTATLTGNAPNGLYMSMAVTVLQDTAFNTFNYFAGFHLGVGATGMSVSNGYAGMIFLRQDPANATNYNFGVAKNNATGTVIGWSPESIAPGETAFLAFQYQFATAAVNNDDTVNLWVNPDLTGPMPASPSATTSTGFDGFTTTGTPPVTTSIIRSAFFRSNSVGVAPYGATPSNLTIDETRVGLSYADITPAATVYWDTNGSTTGAGGAAPSGTWDGAIQNFNNNPAGEAGTFTASPASDQIVAFSAGIDATGTYTVNLSGTRSAKAVNFEQGDVTLTGGTLSTAGFDVASGATGTVTSTVTGTAGGVTKTGPGTLQVSTLPQGSAMTISAGMVRVLESSPGVSSGHPSGDNSFVSRPASLSVADGAQLDITNNDVIIDYSGSSPLAAYEALVASGYNVTGDWQGDGIVSSIAANDGNYVVAIADNATLAAPFGTAQGGPLFSGVDVDLDTILIKFTHRADINLDGVITPDDSAVFGGNYDEGAPAVWATGDMNYDGIFTPDDAAIFGGAYDESLNSLPEPASLGLLAVAGLAMNRRRRRHS